jgi:predicted amidohydrolase
MTAAFVQFAPEYLQPEGNRDAARALVLEADADLIVLPELFTSGYFFRSTEDAKKAAEPIPDGPTTQALIDWAEQTGATLVAGLPERDGRALYNSAVVVDPDGYRGTYRKVHLYYEETLHFASGDRGLPVFDVTTRDEESYRLGVMVCFDWYYPEAARTLVLQGADIIAHPSNLVRPDCPRAMPIRALENHVFTVTANRHGTETKGEETLVFIGQSEICDPEGQIRVRAAETGDEIGRATFDPRTARDRRITAHNDLLADRRVEAYRWE